MSDQGRTPPAQNTTVPLTELPAGGPWSARGHRTGDRIGRFVILEPIGEGGMGQVWSCYDPTLDRRVALKMLRSEHRAGREGRQRVLREARAMARLAHPNVVTVHEVGELDGDAYITMELVEGADLGAWLEAGNRDREALLEVFRQAGRGLAAAHHAGLVHRDFKPRNVLVGADGRARVTDFGLVQPAGSDGDEAPTGTQAPPASDVVTGADAALGTPRYMAPEQLDGGRIDARADQFAFCVALYDALTGAHPYGDGSLEQIGARVRAGERVAAPGERQLPPRLLATLERGLSHSPDNRFASMDELLAAIAPPRRRTRLGLALALAGLAAVTGAALLLHRERTAVDPCAAVAGELDGVWDHATSGAVERAFLATRRPYAGAAYARFADNLDTYAADWAAARGSLCRSRQAHALPPELDLARTLCLDRRRDRLGALVEAFTDAVEPGALDRIVDAVHNLPAIDDCAGADALRAARDLPEAPELRRQVVHARARLDRAEALFWAARHAGARAELDAIDPPDHPATTARLHLLGARVASEQGDNDLAETELATAITAAARARDAGLEAEAWRELMFQIGVRSRRPAEALELQRSAELALLRAGHSERLAADLAATIGAVYLAREDTEAAERHYREALALHQQSGGDDLRLGHILNNLGNVHYFRKELEVARDFYARAAAAYERALGPVHPLVADVLMNSGAAFQEAEEHDQARARYEQALDIWDQVLGPDHPRKGVPLLNLGMIAGAQGDAAASAAYFERARELFEAHFGPDHEYVALALTGLGEAHLATGDLDAARAVLTRALRIRQAGSPAPGRLGETELAMARLLWQAGDRRAALDLARRARDRFQQAGAIWEGKLAEANTWLANR